MRLLFQIVTTLCMMLFASSSYAFFWDGEATCGELITERPSTITWLDHSEVEAMATPEAKTPCTDETIEEGPASVCFIDAGAPMSTFPALLTQMQSERASNHVLNMARNLVASTETKVNTSKVVHPRAHIPVRLVQSRNLECSHYPVECESAPDPLALITFASSASVILTFAGPVVFEPPRLYTMVGPLSPHDGVRLQTRPFSPPTPPPDFA